MPGASILLAAIVLLPRPLVAEGPPQSEAAERSKEEAPQESVEDDGVKPGAGRGEDAPVEDTGTTQRRIAGPDDVPEQIEEIKEAHPSFFGNGPFDSWKQAWDRWNVDLSERYGLDVGLAYTALYQHASPTGGENEAASGDLDLLATWRPGRNENHTLVFHLEDRHRYTDIAPADLGPQFGSAWLTAGTFNTQKVSMVEAYWQGVWREDFAVRVGKIDPSDYYDVHRYQTTNFAFLDEVLSFNPAIGYPDNGFGAVGAFLDDGVYAIGGVHDANGDRTKSGFETIEEGEFFTALEGGVAPTLPGIGKGILGVTVWHRDALSRKGVGSGRGWAAGLEQSFGEEVHGLLRYSRSEGEAAKLRQSAIAAVGFDRPLGIENGLLALGLSWGEPRDRAGEQTVIETLYRLQLTPNIQVTPDLQLVIDPVNAPSSGTVTVLGLRARLAF